MTKARKRVKQRLDITGVDVYRALHDKKREQRVSSDSDWFVAMIIYISIHILRIHMIMDMGIGS